MYGIDCVCVCVKFKKNYHPNPSIANHWQICFRYVNTRIVIFTKLRNIYISIFQWVWASLKRRKSLKKYINWSSWALRAWLVLKQTARIRFCLRLNMTEKNKLHLNPFGFHSPLPSVWMEVQALISCKRVSEYLESVKWETLDAQRPFAFCFPSPPCHNKVCHF